MVESSADAASPRIAAALRGLEPFAPTDQSLYGHAVERWNGAADVRLVRIPFLHLEAEPLVADLASIDVRPEAVVFLSKHKADSGRPAVTVHPVGNPGAAKFGGRPGRFSPSAPGLQTSLLRALARQARRGGFAADATFEVTHHGPLLPWPTCFLELGSGPEQWGDMAGARAVASALSEVLRSPKPPKAPILIGVGGGHYAPRSVEAALNKDVHVGHMVPAHALEATADVGQLIAEAVAATPRANGYLLHKGRLPSDLLDKIDAGFRAQGVPRQDIKELRQLEGPPRANS